MAMALKLSLIAIAWALAILDVLAPGQFVFQSPRDVVEVTDSW